MPVGPDHPIARELRAARAYSGMSRKQVGAAVGISDETLGDWERGAFTREPKPPMLEAIAKATGIPVVFERVVPARGPSVTERARLAALRLQGTPGASSETPNAPGAAGEAP